MAVKKALGFVADDGATSCEVRIRGEGGRARDVGFLGEVAFVAAALKLEGPGGLDPRRVRMYVHDAGSRLELTMSADDARKLGTMLIRVAEVDEFAEGEAILGHLA